MKTDVTTRIAVRRILISLLAIEIAGVVSLRIFGGHATYSVVYWSACLLVTLLPLLVCVFLLCRNRFRFGLQSMLVSVTLVAMFMFVAYLPLQDYLSARSTSSQLLDAGTMPNPGELWWRDYYRGLNLDPTPQPETSASKLLPWLQPFAAKLSLLPPDDAVHRVYLIRDEQVQILCDNVGRLRGMQSISIGNGVSQAALKRLADTFDDFPNLDAVVLIDVHTPKNWYQSLGNVRTVLVWAERNLKGTKLSPESVSSLSTLDKLEVLMVSGYLVDDTDAETLASAPSLQRLVLKGTAATKNGVSLLKPRNPKCMIKLQ